jgi:hypothetical protein
METVDSQTKGDREEDSTSDVQTTGIRVFSVSDIHTDHRENWDLITSWSPSSYSTQTDVLIVAGDISTNLDLMKDTLKHLRPLFREVFFVPGCKMFRIHCINYLPLQETTN